MMLLNKEKNFISAVIYVYNQEQEIYNFLLNLQNILNKNFEKYEIICVNDASTDGSVDQIKKFVSANKATEGNTAVTILNMSFYQGLELSMNAGVDLSIGDFVYEFDTIDSSYSEALIMDVYRRSLSGYDIVSAAPRQGQKMTSKFFYLLFNKTAHTQYILQTEAFRILSRRGINRVHSISKTIPYRKAVYANCGLKTDVIYYENADFDRKMDRETVHKRKETAVDAIILYTDLAYRVSSTFSMLMILFTAAIGLYTIGIYFGGRPVAGWTTTMLFLAFSFGGIFIILTIIIKYMSIILRLNFNKQKYIIESMEKL